jgi:hypothetical protein
MENAVFLQSIGVSGPDTQQICLEAMAKYGENKWWEPDVDPRKYAYYQLKEDYLLGSFGHFHESIELLLGRPVWTHEFGINREALLQEAERAWTYQVGVTSEAEKQERIAESMESLSKWAKEHGKEVISIQLPEG